tara:strand:+ start:140 stop:415 length:276 start_codon:yes stop_codon:yes gene_type:complete
MKLKPHETKLEGKWTVDGNKVRHDATCDRIEWLVTHHLKLITHSEKWGAWKTLFQDTDDGRYWERTYPQGEMQGGGPPRLTMLSSRASFDD